MMDTQQKLIRKAANDLGDNMQADMVIIYTVSFKEDRIRMGCCGKNDKYAELAGHLQDAGFKAMDALMERVAEVLESAPSRAGETQP